MSKSNAWVILGLAGLLFAFALGVLVSRPATAQTAVVADWAWMWPSPPRQRDVWSFREDPAAFVSGLHKAGDSSSVLSGYMFTVAPDAQGRLPVVTENAQPIWKLTDDGSYKKEQMDCSAKWPGIVLHPGEYVLGDTAAENLSQDDGAAGYWATPSRQNDLWCYYRDPSTFGQVLDDQGNYLGGTTFTATADGQGRLPAVVAFVDTVNASDVLYRKLPNGRYRNVGIINAWGQTHPMGFILEPGDYLLKDGYNYGWACEAGLIGYWERP